MSQELKPGGTGAADDANPPGPRPTRPTRLWTYLIVAASAAFCIALVLGAARLYVDVADITDTPEATVDAFLEALLDDRDAEAASAWLCAEQAADPGLDEAIDYLTFIDGPGDFVWDNVTETGRTVGGATVTADVRIRGGHDNTMSHPVTWEFSLVAEDADPQWLVCDLSIV